MNSLKSKIQLILLIAFSLTLSRSSWAAAGGGGGGSIFSATNSYKFNTDQFTVNGTNVALKVGGSVSNLVFKGTNVIYSPSRPSLHFTNDLSGFAFEFYEADDGSLRFYSGDAVSDVVMVDANGLTAAQLYLWVPGDTVFPQITLGFGGTTDTLEIARSAQFKQIQFDLNGSSAALLTSTGLNAIFLPSDVTRSRALILNDIGHVTNSPVTDTELALLAGKTSVAATNQAKIYFPTNLAPYTTLSNPTNSYVVDTLYTNVAQRSLLVGSAVLTNSTLTLLYTNGGVGYSLPMMASNSVATRSFTVPLGPSATFTFVSAGTAYVTNVVNWQQ